MDIQPNIVGSKSLTEKLKKRKVLLISFIFVGVAFILYLGFVIKIKIPSNPLDVLQGKAKVELKTEYKNPFAKETQYVNPFQTYKNPFVVSK